MRVGALDPGAPPFLAPELKFAEEQILLLRELEALDALAAFHVADHEVEARLGQHESLPIRPAGATLLW